MVIIIVIVIIVTTIEITIIIIIIIIVLSFKTSLIQDKGVWRNGSASDSRSEGWEFESLCPQHLHRWWYAFVRSALKKYSLSRHIAHRISDIANRSQSTIIYINKNNNRNNNSRNNNNNNNNYYYNNEFNITNNNKKA